MIGAHKRNSQICWKTISDYVRDVEGKTQVRVSTESPIPRSENILPPQSMLSSTSDFTASLQAVYDRLRSVAREVNEHASEWRNEAEARVMWRGGFKTVEQPLPTWPEELEPAMVIAVFELASVVHRYTYYRSMPPPI